jgi:transposase-like protein
MLSMAGRPTMLTPERAEAIVRSVMGGATKENAARAAGINPATLFDWQQWSKPTNVVTPSLPRR